MRGSRYPTDPSLPFRTATLDHIQCGHLDCAPEERALGANLGLYSVTFNNDLRHDLATLERFHAFCETLKERARAMDADYHRASTAEPVETTLLDYLASRSRWA